MVIINGKKFYEVPRSCGTCPFLMTENHIPLAVILSFQLLRTK